MNCVPITACQMSRTLSPNLLSPYLCCRGPGPSAAPAAGSTPAADAMMIMSTPNDGAWLDSVMDSHRGVDHHATDRYPRPAATTRHSGLRTAWRRRRHHGLVTAVRTGITSLAGALASAVLLLTAAVMFAGAAGADPSQQDQFLALLEQEQIPPTSDGEVTGVVARAHYICGQLNGGTPVDTLIDEEMNRGYAENPRLQLLSDRVRRTVIRFITASVDVYCPRHQGELPPYE